MTSTGAKRRHGKKGESSRNARSDVDQLLLQQRLVLVAARVCRTTGRATAIQTSQSGTGHTRSQDGPARRGRSQNAFAWAVQSTQRQTRSIATAFRFAKQHSGTSRNRRGAPLQVGMAYVKLWIAADKQHKRQEQSGGEAEAEVQQ